MDRVHTVRVHVIGKAARTADTGDKHDVLARRTKRWQHLLHLRQNRIITTTGTPAHVLVTGEIGWFEYGKGSLNAHGS